MAVAGRLALLHTGPVRARRAWLFSVASLVVVAFPAAASAEVFCDYVDAEPEGPAGNVLAVTSAGDPSFFDGNLEEGEDPFAAGIRVTPRRDGTISVIAPGSTPVSCDGGQPTLTNVDRIRIVAADGSLVFVDIGGQGLAPGATDEADGSSEIEMSFAGSYNPLYLYGGAGSDRIVAVGPGRDSPLGLNLNPRADGTDPDIDAAFGEYSLVALLGGGGDDRFTVEPAARPPEDEDDVEIALFMLGGPGDDTIVGGLNRFGDEVLGGRGDDVLRAGADGGDLEGGPGSDRLYAGPDGARLEGGDGADRLFGGEGDDTLIGDGGRDRLIGRAGDDDIRAEDGERDAIDCGPGRDRVDGADHADTRRRCERRRGGSNPNVSDVVEEAVENAEEAVEEAQEAVGIAQPVE